MKTPHVNLNMFLSLRFLLCISRGFLLCSLCFTISSCNSVITSDTQWTTEKAKKVILDWEINKLTRAKDDYNAKGALTENSILVTDEGFTDFYCSSFSKSVRSLGNLNYAVINRSYKLRQINYRDIDLIYLRLVEGSYLMWKDSHRRSINQICL